MCTPYALISYVFTESTRQRAYSLVAQAYTSIAAEDFAAFVGYSVEEAVKGNVISAFFSQPVILLSILSHYFIQSY